MRYDDNAVLRRGRSLKYGFGSNGVRNPRLEGGRRHCPKRSGVASGLDSVSRLIGSRNARYFGA